MKYLCLSLCLWEARTGVDKVLISDKAGGLGTKSSPPHPDLAYNWALIKCDSWEMYSSLVCEQSTSQLGCGGRKSTQGQPVLPAWTCILQGRKISWTAKLAECLGPLTSWKELLLTWEHLTPSAKLSKPKFTWLFGAQNCLIHPGL